MNKEQKRAVRCVCLKILYANSSTGILFNEILDNFNDEEALENINKDQIKYASMLFDLTISNKIELDKLIESKLVNWKIQRLALMDKMILRMSLSEMLYVESVPPKVSISEGIEIVKKFSTDESSSFVNGILDSVFHSLEDLSVSDH